MHRDLKSDFLNYLRVERGLSANTLMSYRYDLRRFETWLREKADREVLSTGREQIVRYVQYLHEEGLGPKSVARNMVAVRGLYRFLILDGATKQDPTINLEAPKSWQTLPKFLTIEEIDLLLKQPDTQSESGLRDRALLELFYASGLRVSEIARLRVDDLQLDLGMVKCVGKGGKERTVPVGDSCLAWIKKYIPVRNRWLRNRKNTVFLFIARSARRSGQVSRDPRRSTDRPMCRESIWRLVRKYARRADIGNVYPHMFRHTFATHLLEHGADLRSVQTMLGHADPTTTQVYTYVTNEHLREVYSKFHPRG
ncbi:MAG: site-specific tyrosine recombinase XerD [Acidobacteria bacterium]|nr:site-specific tyrosine recombinase XerD [Acidobacteriota bacterium]